MNFRRILRQSQLSCSLYFTYLLKDSFSESDCIGFFQHYSYISLIGGGHAAGIHLDLISSHQSLKEILLHIHRRDILHSYGILIFLQSIPLYYNQIVLQYYPCFSPSEK